MGNDSGSGTDDEREKLTADTVDGTTSHKPQRKKSSTKRSLDMQRKISLSKLKDLTSPESNNESSSPSPQHAANHHNSLPLRKTSRFGSMKNGKASAGYDQYMKQYLQIPMPSDYGEPSSDDLSSEWDSDVADNKASDTNKESKVSVLFSSAGCCLHYNGVDLDLRSTQDRACVINENKTSVNIN